MQLVWLLKVLKGPHVSRLGLGAETDHAQPGLSLGLPHLLHSPTTVGRSAPHLQQEVPKGHKCGSVLWLVGPALDHDIVDVLGAVLRPGQALPFLVNLMQDLPARAVQRLGGQSICLSLLTFPLTCPAAKDAACHACPP